MRCTLIAIVVAGCHVERPPKMPVSEAWLEVTDPTYAKAHASYVRHTALPFKFLRGGVDGTQLVIQFLSMAEARGGAYASNLAIVVQMMHDGSPIECVSKVVLEGTPEDPGVAPANDPDSDAIGSTTLRPWHPDLVTAQVDDHDYKCERHATPLVYADHGHGGGDAMQADYSPGRKRIFYINTPLDPEIVTADWEDKCDLVTKHRKVERYEHYIAAHFQPPEWDRLSPIFASRKLVELAPECHSVVATGKPFQRIEADIGYVPMGPQVHTKPMPQPDKQDLAFTHTRARLMKPQ